MNVNEMVNKWWLIMTRTGWQRWTLITVSNDRKKWQNGEYGRASCSSTPMFKTRAVVYTLYSMDLSPRIPYGGESRPTITGNDQPISWGRVTLLYCLPVGVWPMAPHDLIHHYGRITCGAILQQTLLWVSCLGRDMSQLLQDLHA